MIVVELEYRSTLFLAEFPEGFGTFLLQGVAAGRTTLTHRHFRKPLASIHFSPTIRYCQIAGLMLHCKT